MHNVISQLVFAAPRCQFTDVWVAGRRLLDDRRLTTLDEDGLLARTARWRQRIAETPAS